MGVTAALQEEAINGIDVSAEWISAENCPQTDFTKPGTIETCEAYLMNVVDNCRSALALTCMILPKYQNIPFLLNLDL
jgi:hypothetical protein